jgi:hypothetical protein
MAIRITGETKTSMSDAPGPLRACHECGEPIQPGDPYVAKEELADLRSRVSAGR